MAAMIDQHNKGKKTIVGFLGSLPDGLRPLERVRRLPSVWRARILIVDDDAHIVRLLSTFLATEGDVETAENGERALQMTSENHFDVIISDVSMPVMNGIEFYEQAAKADPSIRERFLFLTGYPIDENINFFAKNELRHMRKPMPLYKVRQAVQDIMTRSSGLA